MANKKAKMRTCIACRACKDKSEFLRVTKQGEDVFFDKEGKLFGRSAYICKNEECLTLAEKTNRLAGAFKKDVDKKIYIELKEALDEQ